MKPFFLAIAMLVSFQSFGATPQTSKVQKEIPQEFEVSVPVENFELLADNPEFALEESKTRRLRLALGYWTSNNLLNLESSQNQLNFSQTKIPSLKVDYVLAPSYKSNWTLLRASIGLGFYRFQRSNNVAVLNDSQIDSQTLDLFPIRAATDLELGRGVLRDKLHFYVTGSLAPTFFYKSKSLTSEGGSNWGFLFDLGLRAEFNLNKENTLALSYENLRGTVSDYSKISIQNIFFSFQRAI